MENNAFGFVPKSRNCGLRVLHDELSPVVIDGVDILDTIVPICESTGRRANPLQMLSILTGNSEKTR